MALVAVHFSGAVFVAFFVLVDFLILVAAKGGRARVFLFTLDFLFKKYVKGRLSSVVVSSVLLLVTLILRRDKSVDCFFEAFIAFLTLSSDSQLLVMIL